MATTIPFNELDPLTRTRPAQNKSSERHELTPSHYPKPTGYRLLIKPIKREAKSSGGIVLAEETQQSDSMLNTVGQVLAFGNECYRHADRIAGSWCEVGNYVVYRRHAGTTVTIREPDGSQTKLVFLADDEILAITESPESVVAYVG